MAVELGTGPESRAAEELLPVDLPTRPRASAVVDGVLAGRVWADDPARPTWAIVMENADGTVYVGGEPSADELVGVLRGVTTAAGDLIFGFRGPDDPVRGLLPGTPYWSGEAIDFLDRIAPDDEEEELAAGPPAGLRLADLDAETLPGTEWYADTLVAYGSVEAWLERGVGRVLLDGGRVVAEAMAGPRVRGTLEMGVATRGPYRRRGCGTYVSRLVARACEDRGDRVWWNANASNLPSVRIARRLGFRTERRYDLVAFRTDAFGS
jgi:GNAT superfamily N-acetyltransferase